MAASDHEPSSYTNFWLIQAGAIFEELYVVRLARIGFLGEKFCARLYGTVAPVSSNCPSPKEQYESH